MWTGYFLCRRVMSRYGVPLASIYQWRKLGLALLASLLALGVLHGLLGWLPHGATAGLLALLAFALTYTLAARFILREEYGYVMRAFLRRRAA